MKQLQKLQVKASPDGSGVSVLTMQLIMWLVPHIHKIMPTYYAVIMLDAFAHLYAKIMRHRHSNVYM